ncbi:lipase family alpha/beta hydrolase [Paraburkholderia sp. J7]|uniref:lipase family alpha/beta hydrolase n=1 Tax=Paraburkholderia sp. J7 TaxID=2805438 RepID=UPI002AB6282E|nr:alpha/beta fold hydrolase [Paraburkholderia sp. J7]
MATLECTYRPQTRGRFSIVFIHGLGGDPRLTWMCDPKNEATFWPTWVGEDCNCDTWVLGYGAKISRWSDTAMALPTQGTSVLDRLDSEPELKGRPLVLVGHSLGGLVIKAAIIQPSTMKLQQYANLAGRVRGVVFIATPHNGSEIANAISFLKSARTNPQVGDLNADNPYLPILDYMFLGEFKWRGFHVRTFVETKPTHGIMVVKSGSADPHVPGEKPIPIEADHLSICKPENRREQIHISLVDFIRDCSIDAPPAEVADDQTLNLLRQQTTERDVIFLRVGKKRATYDWVLSDDTVEKAPFGEIWEKESKERAEARAKKLIRLGLMEPRGTEEVETSALGEALLAYDDARRKS